MRLQVLPKSACYFLWIIDSPSEWAGVPLPVCCGVIVSYSCCLMIVCNSQLLKGWEVRSSLGLNKACKKTFSDISLSSLTLSSKLHHTPIFTISHQTGGNTPLSPPPSHPRVHYPNTLWCVSEASQPCSLWVRLWRDGCCWTPSCSPQLSPTVGCMTEPWLVVNTACRREKKSLPSLQADIDIITFSCESIKLY